MTTTSPNTPNLPSPQHPPAIENRRANVVCLNELEPRPVEWLWQHRLAIGTLALLSGAPGAGKTWVALAIAAALTRGRTPFSGEWLNPCDILYAATGSDGPDVLLPRFAKLNGDLSRLYLLRGVVSGSSDHPAPFSLRDTSILDDALQQTQARLLVIDPLHSSFGVRGRPNQPADARPLLDNLALLAEKRRCCILFIRHLGKRGDSGAVRRGPGPVELSAAVRTEFLAGSSPDAPSRGALLQVKSNLGPLAPALSYHVDDAGSFAWTGYSELRRDQILSDRPLGGQRKFVADWLRHKLRDGKLMQGVVESDARKDGISTATLRRSKFDVGIRSFKEDLHWYWALASGEQA